MPRRVVLAAFAVPQPRAARHATARLLAVVLTATAFFALAVGQARAAAVITNGTVALGINNPGMLIFNDGTRNVGLMYEPTTNDATRAGQPYEGWGAGVADPAGNFSGRADRAHGGTAGVNLDNVTFTSTASTATSSATIDDKLKVTHAFAPSPSTANLYEIKVTLENIGSAALPDVRYTRAMDWDAEPTPFDEFITIKRGSTPAPAGDLLYSNDNGFDNPDPFASRSANNAASVNADFEDIGPDDLGVMFDFGFGELAPGEKKEFSLFYGATATEAAANAVVSAAGLEVFSYAQPSSGQTTGEPNTFILGFKGVGGAPVIPPTLDLTPATASHTVGTSHTVTAELKDSSGSPVPNAALVFEVAGANQQAPSAKTTDADGKATFTYTGSNAGDDTITACLDNNGNTACDANEVTDKAAKRWAVAVVPPPPAPEDVPLAASDAVVSPPAPSSDRSGPPPAITGLSVARRCVRSARLTAPTSGTSGLSFGFSLSQDATVRYEISRRNGSPRWSSCPRRSGTNAGRYTGVAKVTGQSRSGQRDTKLATTASRSGVLGGMQLGEGRRRVPLARIAARRKLSPGTYILRMTASNANGEATQVKAKFWVIGR